MLLCCILLNLTSTNPNRDDHFKHLNIIVWPFGLLLQYVIWCRFDLFQLNYNENYIFSASCQPELLFQLSDDGKDCLLIKEGKVLTTIYYGTNMVIIICSQIVFVLILHRAYADYKKLKLYRERAVDENEEEDFGALQVSINFSYSVLKSSLPFAVTAFLYIFVDFPVILSRIFKIYSGPVQGKRNLQFFLQLWFLCSGNLTTLVNILLYTFVNKKLRVEIAKRVKTRYQSLRSLMTTSFTRDLQIETLNTEDHSPLTNDSVISSYYDDED